MATNGSQAVFTRIESSIFVLKGAIDTASKKNYP